MALNIMDFRTQLLLGGFRPNLFRVDLSFPSQIDSLKGNNGDKPASAATLNKAASFLIKSAQVPSMDIGVIPVPFRGRELKVAGDRTFENFSCTVINDGEFRLRKGFEAWSRGINALTENVSELGYSNGAGTNKISYLQDITLHLLSRDNVVPERTPANASSFSSATDKILRSYRLYGAWVSSLSGIELGYELNNQISQYNVTFAFQFFEVLPSTTSSN
jgi:hypothetical protein